jgi:hypothetical protein
MRELRPALQGLMGADGAGARRHVLCNALLETAALCYWAGPGGSRQPANAVTTVASPITLLEQRGGACLAPGKWGPTGPSNGEAPQLRSLELASKMVPACLFHVLIFVSYYT